MERKTQWIGNVYEGHKNIFFGELDRGWPAWPAQQTPCPETQHAGQALPYTGASKFGWLAFKSAMQLAQLRSRLMFGGQNKLTCLAYPAWPPHTHEASPRPRRGEARGGPLAEWAHARSQIASPGLRGDLPEVLNSSTGILEKGVRESPRRAGYTSEYRWSECGQLSGKHHA
eukprot:1145447-Pelagomonas_calceolata.AAC.12